MEQNNEKTNSNTIQELLEQVDKKLEELKNEKIQQGNVDYVYKLVDIRKDIKEMEDKDMYRNYGMNDEYEMYRGGRSRDSRGRYMGNNYGNYGRRYRGHDMLNDMEETYGTYMENRDNGRYGSPETSKAFDYMLQSAEDFFKHLKTEAGSEEEMEKIRRTARRISEM